MHRPSRHGLALAMLIVTSTTGCEAFRSLRRLLHPEQSDGEGLGSAGLRIEVEPADGISILVDDVRVASISPYEDRKLKPGAHQLEVRAMGYYTFTMPVVLQNDKLVTIPVALRARPPTDPEAKRPSAPRSKVPEPPPPPAAVLPEGEPKVSLTLAPTPEATIQLDRVSLAGRQAVLSRAAGELTVGAMSLRYSIGAGSVLKLHVPSDGAQWSKDGAPLKAGTAFKLHQGVVRIRRVASDGQDQSLLIRR